MQILAFGRTKMMKKIVYILWKISRYFRYAYSTPISYLLLRFNQVTIGKSNLFDGLIHVVNQPGNTSIIIGNKCKFNSNQRSNLIGINHPCILSTHLWRGKIEIGNFCGFSATSIGAFESIKIGNHVRCGANTVITDGDWHMDDLRVGPAEPVNIHDNVWLGYGVLVLKGVEIGENSIIGAGSVVTSSIPANVVATGNPCKVVRDLAPR